MINLVIVMGVRSGWYFYISDFIQNTVKTSPVGYVRRRIVSKPSFQTYGTIILTLQSILHNKPIIILIVSKTYFSFFIFRVLACLSFHLKG